MGIIHKLFFSMGSAVVFFLIFGVASGAATIIESMYNTQTAWALVYGAGWFALIQLILGEIGRASCRERVCHEV